MPEYKSGGRYQHKLNFSRFIKMFKEIKTEKKSFTYFLCYFIFFCDTSSSVTLPLCFDLDWLRSEIKKKVFGKLHEVVGRFFADTCPINVKGLYTCRLESDSVAEC